MKKNKRTLAIDFCHSHFIGLVPPVWEIAVHLAVACDVFIDVSVLSFFPRDVLDEILDLIGSVSEGFPTYF